jgi:hypothetical protein
MSDFNKKLGEVCCGSSRDGRLVTVGRDAVRVTEDGQMEPGSSERRPNANQPLRVAADGAALFDSAGVLRLSETAYTSTGKFAEPTALLPDAAGGQIVAVPLDRSNSMVKLTILDEDSRRELANLTIREPLAVSQTNGGLADWDPGAVLHYDSTRGILVVVTAGGGSIRCWRFKTGPG